MGDAAQIYFATAQSIEAGKGYIVNANAKLALKTSFVFPNVTINTDSDTGDITALTCYNDGTDNLYLVGCSERVCCRGRLTGMVALQVPMLLKPVSTSATASSISKETAKPITHKDSVLTNHWQMNNKPPDTWYQAACCSSMIYQGLTVQVKDSLKDCLDCPGSWTMAVTPLGRVTLQRMVWSSWRSHSL